MTTGPTSLDHSRPSLDHQSSRIKDTIERHLKGRDGIVLWQVKVTGQRPQSNHNAWRSELALLNDKQQGEFDREVGDDEMSSKKK